jgi:hypothetical protein
MSILHVTLAECCSDPEGMEEQPNHNPARESQPLQEETCRRVLFQDSDVQPRIGSGSMSFSRRKRAPVTDRVAARQPWVVNAFKAFGRHCARNQVRASNGMGLLVTAAHERHLHRSAF